MSTAKNKDPVPNGISSAAGVFQYQVQTALAGIPGCRSLSDNIIIFGKTQQEHKQALCNVCQRLSEKGLTLNKRKCTFNKANLNFYGYTFSAEGMKADEKKVQAIKETLTPKTVSELCSFLGLVNWEIIVVHNLRQKSLRHASFVLKDAFQARKLLPQPPSPHCNVG